MENWKNIEDLEVSNLGNFRRNGIIIKQYEHRYLYVMLLGGKIKSAHRLVALAFIPNPENKPQVNHIDANKLNNCISNLEWVTQQENIQHAYKNGLFESQRLALSKAHSKPVIDIITKKKYTSLKSACDDIGEPYSRHLMRIYMSYKTNRFMYI
jgi:hypothetical protein